MEIYDISQTLLNGIAVWPGDPAFCHRRLVRLAEGGFSNTSAVDMCVHTGTHIDAPLHIDDTGCDVADLTLDACVGPARVLELRTEKSIRVPDVSRLDWTGVRRVIFKTQRGPAGRRFDEEYVYIEKDAAGYLADLGLMLVGTDSPSVDDFASTCLPSHHLLLQNGIVILEGARLEHVPPGDYELICLPLKLAGSDGAPVRAILRR